MQKLTLLILLTFISILGFSQTTAKLVGKITGEDNKPVAGASVKVVGSKQGTVTNFDGDFSLLLAVGKKYEIEISAVGFATKKISDVEVNLNGGNDLSVVLQTKSNNLNEVSVKSSLQKKKQLMP